MADSGLYINVDISDVSDYLYGIGQEKQIDFAVSVAINKVMRLIKDAIRGDMKSRIKFRKLAWNIQSINISKWANKNSLLGILEIDPRASNLERLTTGDDFLPLNGRKYVAMPNVKVFGRKIVTRDNPLSTSSLNLRDTPTGLRGDKGTFLIHANGKPLILQSLAAETSTDKAEMKAIRKRQKGRNKKTGNRLLYTLVSSKKTPIKLDFYGIAQKIVDQYLMDELMAAVQQAINSPKRKK